MTLKPPREREEPQPVHELFEDGNRSARIREMEKAHGAIMAGAAAEPRTFPHGFLDGMRESKNAQAQRLLSVTFWLFERLMSEPDLLIRLHGNAAHGQDGWRAQADATIRLQEDAERAGYRYDDLALAVAALARAFP